MRDFYNKIPELLNIKAETNERKLQKSQKEKRLETEKAIDIKELRGGANKVFIVKLADGTMGIFKPKGGEQKRLRDGIETGSFYKRERAAYLVDCFFDFDLVPTTVIREINGEVGSFQEFIPDTVPGWNGYTKTKSKGDIEKELMKMWIFDLIIWSLDRHGYNFLMKKNKIYAIDNGLSFGKATLTTFNRYFDKPIPEEIIDKFKKFFENKEENEKILRMALEDLLSKEEIDSCVKRINAIGNLIINNKVISEIDWSDIKFN